MKHITFSGSSDDIITVGGDILGCDEYHGEFANFQVAGIVIQVAYKDSGCWSISVYLINQRIPCRAQNIILSEHINKYSIQLAMDVPDDTCITRVG